MDYNPLDPIDTLQASVNPEKLTARQRQEQLQAAIDAHNASINSTANAESMVPTPPSTSAQSQTDFLKQRLPQAIAQNSGDYYSSGVMNQHVPGLPGNSTLGQVQQSIAQNPDVQQMRQNLGQQADLYKQELSRPAQVDLSAPAALLDSWYGGNLAKSITKPEDRTQLRSALLKQIESGQQGMTDEQRKQLHDIMANGNNLALQRLGQRDRLDAERTVNKDPELISAQQRLNGTLRIKDIIDKVKSGKLKDTTQIKNSIGNEYAMLQTGVSNMGLGKEERSTIGQTLEEEKNNFLYKFDAAIRGGALPVEAMAQLEKEINTLAPAYMAQLDQRHQMLIAGTTPERAQIMNSKISNLRGNLTNRFGGWQGLPEYSTKNNVFKSEKSAPRQVTSVELKKYADESFNGDQSKAKDFLKGKGYATD